jgi:hypothetical protein
MSLKKTQALAPFAIIILLAIAVAIYLCAE